MDATSRFLAVILLAVVSGCSADIPNGWRFPVAGELDGQSLRNESGSRYAQATADFDGDGKDDSAYLLKSTTVSGQGLLVRLSSTGWKILDEIDWGEDYPDVDLAMGIEVVPPGLYESACGKGYWDCAPDEPAEIELENPGLRYFQFESASSIFHWDAASGELKRTWISD